MSITLLAIDCQFDFTNPNGSLFVKGADQDMENLSNFVRKNIDKIDDIILTIDSHHKKDIAHPTFWLNDKREHPDPFEVIKKEDLLNKYWPAGDDFTKVHQYLTKLEESGKHDLRIWPEHCIIDTEGINIDYDFFDAVAHWEQVNLKKAEYVVKGTNRFTEHYSAVEAEVPFADSPETGVNWDLVQKIYNSDLVYVGGEALSHCVAETLKSLAKYLGNDASKFVLLTDCTSNVEGFEDFGTKAVEQLSLLGMGTTITRAC